MNNSMMLMPSKLIEKISPIPSSHWIFSFTQKLQKFCVKYRNSFLTFYNSIQISINCIYSSADKKCEGTNPSILYFRYFSMIYLCSRTPDTIDRQTQEILKSLLRFLPKLFCWYKFLYKDSGFFCRLQQILDSCFRKH